MTATPPRPHITHHMETADYVALTTLCLLPLAAIIAGILLARKPLQSHWMRVFFISAAAYALLTASSLLLCDWLLRREHDLRLERTLREGVVIRAEDRYDAVRYHVEMPNGVIHIFDVGDERPFPLGLMIQVSIGAGIILAAVTLATRAVTRRFFPHAPSTPPEPPLP